MKRRKQPVITGIGGHDRVEFGMSLPGLPHRDGYTDKTAQRVKITAVRSHRPFIKPQSIGRLLVSDIDLCEIEHARNGIRRFAEYFFEVCLCLGQTSEVQIRQTSCRKGPHLQVLKPSDGKFRVRRRRACLRIQVRSVLERRGRVAAGHCRLYLQQSRL